MGTTINRTSPESANPSDNVSNGSTLDFNAELTKHLTLKKQKQEQQVNATEANLRTNRGPPPQPPNKSSKTQVSETVSNTTTSYAFKQQSHHQKPLSNRYAIVYSFAAQMNG